MATKQKEQESTDLVPLAEEVGDKLVKAFAEASHVAVISETDPKAAMAEIVGRILEATNIEELNAVFSDDAGRNSRDLAESGTPVELRSMNVRTSNFADPVTGLRGWYGQFDAVDLDTGEKIRISSTSKSVMAAFVVADALGLVPVRGRFEYGSETEAGYTPVHFTFEK